MSTTILCPHCQARLVLKDESILGKKVTCPKCQTQFRTKKKSTPALLVEPEVIEPEVVQPRVVKPHVSRPQAKPMQPAKPAASETSWDSLSIDDDASNAASANIDFGDLGNVNAPLAHPGMSSPDYAQPSASAWSAPTRQVPLAPVAVSRETQLKRQSQRDRTLFIAGLSVGSVLLVALLMAGSWFVFQSVQKTSRLAAASRPGPGSESETLNQALKVMMASSDQDPVNSDETAWLAPIKEVYPQLMETTPAQEDLLRDNLPIRDIERVEGFQATALKFWGEPGAINGFDATSHAHREMRARIIAGYLRSAIAEGTATAPPKEEWQAFVQAEEAMFGDEALTKMALKDDVPGRLGQVRDKLEQWSPTLGFDMPRRSRLPATSSSSSSSSDDEIVDGRANLPTIFGFDARKRSIMVDYLKEQGHSSAKARLTMAQTCAALGKFADEMGIPRTEQLPEELEKVREAVAAHLIPRDQLRGAKVPAIFDQLLIDYQNEQLKPEEEELVLYVVIAFVAEQM